MRTLGANLSDPYIEFVTNQHPLYSRYYEDWRLCVNSYYGGVEYKNAKYLRAYAVDMSTPGETINTYITGDDGMPMGKSPAKLQIGTSTYDTDKESDIVTGNFYKEKLDNTPLYNYVKLIAAEYNALLFRNPPQRNAAENEDARSFMRDVDGEGSSINEFMSQVDIYTTVFGVVHAACIKPIGSEMPKWRVFTPLQVTNWEYQYLADGSLVMTKMVVQLEKTQTHTVCMLITADEIHTVFMGEDDDYVPPIADPNLQRIDQNTYRVVQPNELGYCPVHTFYQSTKVYNNVGTTVIQDVAQIQRSIYGDMAEIYSAITYGAHPTLIVDENTDQLNDGAVGAEPGSIVKVAQSLTGESSYVYEFRAPSLDAIDAIRELVDNKVQKLSQIAMLRSEDLIRAANSGAQIEVFDDKLSAMVRKKATNLENGEAKLWDIWFDWMNQTMPEDFSISYNRQYNRRALEIELREVDLMMQTLEKYESLMVAPKQNIQPAPDLPNIPNRTYPDGAAIPNTLPAKYQLADGAENCGNCAAFMSGACVLFNAPVRENYVCARWVPTQTNFNESNDEFDDFKKQARDKIRERLKELFDSSTTRNGW
jgi:hypothetical protein